jgi:hypothetical protein
MLATRNSVSTLRRFSHQTVIFAAFHDSKIAGRAGASDPRKRRMIWSDHVGGLYKDPDQEAVSQSAIEALAKETSRPVDEVKNIYEDQFARLSEGARIHDYLILFASRHTRDVLVHGRR